MFKWFLPKTYSFFEYFEQHSEIIVEASDLLLKIIIENQDSNLHAMQITRLEKKADGITHQCIEALHKTFITPFERNDIYRLMTHLDDILDGIENVATRIVLYKLLNMPESVKHLARIVDVSIKEIRHVVHGLRKLQDGEQMQKRFITIHHLENEADEVLNTAIGNLFDEEKDPLKVIKWKEIYENLEAITDSCEDVANIVDGVIIEST